MREQSFSFPDRRFLNDLFAPTPLAVSPRDRDSVSAWPRPKERVMNLLSRVDFDWKKFFAYMGPGAMISIAYIDPGNIDIDIQAGARFAYSLVWAMLLSIILGTILQYLSLKLGIVTGLSLGQLTKENYTRPVTIFLWVLTEIGIICSDIPQVLGSAFALKLILNIPLYLGVFISLITVILLVFTDIWESRKVEVMIFVMLGVTLVCVLIQFFMVGVDTGQMLAGFVPSIPQNSMFLIICFIGSVVMPYNLFLHSSLVNTRDIAKNPKAYEEAIFYNVLEFSISSFLCFVINLAMISLSAAEFHSKGNTSVILLNAPLLIKSLVGGMAPFLFAISILAASQSSIITTTIAGQLIINEFLNLKMSRSTRAILTRTFAVIPSLIVILLVNETGVDFLIITTQAIISILIPFPLVSLLKFTSSEKLMGKFANGICTVIAISCFGFIVCLANIAVFWDKLFDYIVDKNVFVRIAVMTVSSLVTSAYIIFIYYLAKLENKIKMKYLGDRDGWDFNFSKMFEDVSDDVSVFEAIASDLDV